jgi:hypothetical protein
MEGERDPVRLHDQLTCPRDFGPLIT